MTVLEEVLYFLSEVWDIALWTGAWYVLPMWILIELIIATTIAFIRNEKSKELPRNNWKQRYFKQLATIAIFLLVVRIILTILIICVPISTTLTIELLSFTIHLLIGAVLSSTITVGVLVKFHLIQSVRVKAYLIFLSIPITLFYSAAIHIALF